MTEKTTGSTSTMTELTTTEPPNHSRFFKSLSRSDDADADGAAGDDGELRGLPYIYR